MEDNEMDRIYGTHGRLEMEMKRPLGRPTNKYM
jgi:hypothetical protein